MEGVVVFNGTFQDLTTGYHENFDLVTADAQSIRVKATASNISLEPTDQENEETMNNLKNNNLKFSLYHSKENGGGVVAKTKNQENLAKTRNQEDQENREKVVVKSFISQIHKYYFAYYIKKYAKK